MTPHFVRVRRRPRQLSRRVRPAQLQEFERAPLANSAPIAEVATELELCGGDLVCLRWHSWGGSVGPAWRWVPVPGCWTPIAHDLLLGLSPEV